MPNQDLFAAYQKGIKETQTFKDLDSRWKHSGMTLRQAQGRRGGRKRGLSHVDCTLFPDKRIPSPLRGEDKDGGDSLFSTFSQHYQILTPLSRKIRRALQKKWKHSLAGIALVLALGVSPAMAATIIVTPEAVDNDNGSGNCSIIEAITTANTDAQVDNCIRVGTSGEHTIVLDGSTFTLTEVNNSDLIINSSSAGNNGLPVITSEIIIEGNGSTIRRDPADADEFRIFAIDGEGDDANGDLTLNNTTISGGFANAGGFGDDGGGIFTFGDVTAMPNTNITLNNSTISGNIANNDGGGIFSDGILIITNSTISGNMANGETGGGGGIFNFFGTATITNSTITNNSADNDDGGGIFNNAGTFNIQNTIVAGNSAEFNMANNCGKFGGTVNDNGNNLSDDGNSGTPSSVECFDGSMSSSSQTDFDVNTFLADLADNGGLTETHALLDPDNNLAVDAISGNCVDQQTTPELITTDQRGFPRPSNTNCDIGSFEVQQEPFIKITKLTDPTVTGNNFSFDLDGMATFELADGEMFSSALSEGTFTLTEMNPIGFILKEVECTDESIEPTVTVDNDSDPTAAMLGFTLMGTQRLECEVINTNEISVLDVTISGDGSGVVLGQGIDCPTECSEPFLIDSMTTLTATPDSGSTFEGFTGAGCTGGSPIDVTVVNGGVTCDAEFAAIDECDPNPCDNGGICTDGVDTFTCDCSDTGFEGDMCETDIDECTDMTDNCDENAVCTNTSGSFECDCEEGFEGDGVSCEPEDTGDDDDDLDNNIEIGNERTDDNGVRVEINVGSGVLGGGTILVNVPSEVKLEFANLIPNVGECVFVDESEIANVPLSEADVFCDVDEFPTELDLDLGLCLDDEDAEGVANAQIEVQTDNPNQEVSAFIQIILNELDECDGDGGGCSIAPASTSKANLLSNFFVMLIPAIVGFSAMFFRRKKD